MNLDVVNSQNEKVGTLEVSDEVFGGRIRDHLVWESVVHANAAERRGTHMTKTRGLVSGTGKKPWRQKGTGRARVGEARNPLWRKGGTVFGPQPRSYDYRVSSFGTNPIFSANRNDSRARRSCFDPVPQGLGKAAHGITFAGRQGVNAFARGFRDFPEGQSAEDLGFHDTALLRRQDAQGVVQGIQQAGPDTAVQRVEAGAGDDLPQGVLGDVDFAGRGAHPFTPPGIDQPPGEQGIDPSRQVADAGHQGQALQRFGIDVVHEILRLFQTVAGGAQAGQEPRFFAFIGRREPLVRITVFRRLIMLHGIQLNRRARRPF